MAGKKKKTFIDKKCAATYCLLPGNKAVDAQSAGSTRRQHVTWVRTDVNAVEDVFGCDDSTGEMCNRHALGSEADSTVDPNSAYDMLPADRENLGLPDDGYDYARHLRVCESDTHARLKSNDAEWRESIMLSSFVLEGSSQERENVAKQVDKEVEETMKMLDDASQTDSDNIVSECGSLQDDICELADRDVGTSIDVQEIMDGTSALRLDSAKVELGKLRRSPMQNRHQMTLHGRAFDRVMSEYSDEDIGASTVAVLERTQAAEVSQIRQDTLTRNSLTASLTATEMCHAEDIAEDVPTSFRATYFSDAPTFHAQTCSYDCESVLSMHSNVSHHPKLIGDSHARRSRVSSNNSRRLENSDEQVDSTPVVECDLAVEDETWRSMIVRKGESPQQKRERKAAVKEGRKHARIRKKGMKDSFQNARQEMSISTNGVSVRPSISVRTLH